MCSILIYFLIYFLILSVIMSVSLTMLLLKNTLTKYEITIFLAN